MTDFLSDDGMFISTHGSCVQLKRLTHDSIDQGYLKWINDPAINRYLESRLKTWSASDLAEYITQTNASTKNWLFGIYAEGFGYIGNIKLGPIEEYHSRASIGIMVGNVAAHGKGYGSAAVQQIMELGFVRLGLQKLTAGCYAPNVMSRKLFEKVGFTVEGILQSHAMTDEGRCDVILMGCLSDAYQVYGGGK